jgi:hypothetical protein
MGAAGGVSDGRPTLGRRPRAWCRTGPDEAYRVASEAASAVLSLGVELGRVVDAVVEAVWALRAAAPATPRGQSDDAQFLWTVADTLRNLRHPVETEIDGPLDVERTDAAADRLFAIAKRLAGAPRCPRTASGSRQLRGSASGRIPGASALVGIASACGGAARGSSRRGANRHRDRNGAVCGSGSTRA